MQKKLHTEVSQFLEEARTFAQQGKREQAYQSSLRATTLAPDEPLAWFLRSRSAPSTEEQLMCLSRAYSLDPNVPDTQKELRSAVHTLLKQEPFLAYVYETEQFYQVRSGRDLLINIPKNRTYEIPYLKKKPGLAQPAFRWLSFAVLTLFLDLVPWRCRSRALRAHCSFPGLAAASICSIRRRAGSFIDCLHSVGDHLACGHPY
jgi:hypothetical protein